LDIEEKVKNTFTRERATSLKAYRAFLLKTTFSFATCKFNAL
jgi:hypothetical protein